MSRLGFLPSRVIWVLSFMVLGQVAGNAQTTQSPELIESRELTARVLRLYSESKYDEALPLAKRALQLRESALGASHPDLIPLLSNLAELQKARQQLTEARSYLERALAISETVLKDDIRSAYLLDKLGYVAFNQKKPKDAENFFLKSLQIKEKAMGPETADTVQTAFDLAEIYRFRKEYEKAEPLYARALRVREKEPSTKKSDLIRTFEAYLATLHELKRTSEEGAVQQRLSQLLASEGTVQGGVLNGKALKLVQPDFPAIARNSGGGIVRVQVVIDENGKVISAKAVDPGPVHLALIAAAEDAARHSLFTPTRLSGVPIKVSGIIVYRFAY
jgi:tetratricopeptide (TPR) repeat protein